MKASEKKKVRKKTNKETERFWFIQEKKSNITPNK